MLVSATAFEQFEEQLLAASAGHGARWLTMTSDGELRPTGPNPRDSATCAAGAPTPTIGDVTVAWATADLFGAGRAIATFNAHLRAAVGLEWFQSAGAGTEHSIYRELLDRGVRVTTNHSSTAPIAEFVVRAVLDCFQEAWRWRAGEAAHEWRRHDFREVDGTTWLIVGMGRIGSAVAVRAAALGGRVVGVRRSAAPAPAAHELVTPDALLDAVPRADVIVLTAPATPATHHLVGHELLARVRPGSVLVNVARGELVDDDALLAALDRGAPAWAVLDALAVEPLPPEHPYWSHPRAVITPHASGMGIGRYERGTELFLDNLARWMSGAPLLNEVHDATWALGAPVRAEGA